MIKMPSILVNLYRKVYEATKKISSYVKTLDAMMSGTSQDVYGFPRHYCRLINDMTKNVMWDIFKEIEEGMSEGMQFQQCKFLIGGCKGCIVKVNDEIEKIQLSMPGEEEMIEAGFHDNEDTREILLSLNRISERCVSYAANALEEYEKLVNEGVIEISDEDV